MRKFVQMTLGVSADDYEKNIVIQEELKRCLFIIIIYLFDNRILLIDYRHQNCIQSIEIYRKT